MSDQRTFRHEKWDEIFEEYFAKERRAVWDRRCQHTGLCSCVIWDREMRDLETYSEGRLQVIHFGNKLNLGGCNVCSAIDGRAHCFDKITVDYYQNLIVSCDCMYRDPTSRPEGCTCPDQGYGLMDEGEEE